MQNVDKKIQLNLNEEAGYKSAFAGSFFFVFCHVVI